MPPTDNGSPRPPEGDWLGTPFLTFRRDGPFAIVTLGRPEARNAMTPAITGCAAEDIGAVLVRPALIGVPIVHQRTAIPLLFGRDDFHGDRQGVGSAISGGPIGIRDGPGEILH